MDTTLIENYLNHINFKGHKTPTLETLVELHKLHTLKFPFENLTPFMHQEVSLDCDVVARKFLEQGRGGYCFEQNLLFKTVLAQFGFDVQGLGARVLWNQDENLITRRSHMLILVTIEGVKYIADVGFGGLTLTTPIKFAVDLEQKTTHETFRLSRMSDDFKLQANVGGEWKTLYRFDLQEQHPIDYEVANFFLYTHPTSIFRNNLIAAKPVRDGRYALSNNQFTWYPLNGNPEKKTLTSVSQVKDILESTFGIQLPVNQLLDEKIEALLK